MPNCTARDNIRWERFDMVSPVITRSVGLRIRPRPGALDYMGTHRRLQQLE